MIEEKFIELMHKKIDKAISDEENVILEEYLHKHTEAQDYYKELVNLSELLIQVKEVDPPQSIKKNILNAIPLNKYAKKGKENLWYKITNSFNFKISPGYAYSFSAGIVAGIIILAVFTKSVDNNPPLDISELYGTIILNGSLEGFQTTDKKEFEFGEIFGVIETKYVNNIVLAEVEIFSPREIDIVIEFDESDIDFDGFRQQSQVPNNFFINKNFVKLKHQGNNSYSFFFKDRTQSISQIVLKLYSGDLVFIKKVHTGQENK